MVAVQTPAAEALEVIRPAGSVQNEPSTALLERLTGLATMDRDAMIERHLPLVRYVAGTMSRHARASSIVDYEDLVGYGTEGLIDAVDSFNPSYNVRFSTWAVMHIRTTIQDALRSLDPLSRSLRSKGKAIEKAQYALANQRGVWPADVEVAQELGISIEKLHHLQQDINRSVVSLENVSEGNGDEPGTSILSSLAETDPECDPESRLDAIEMRLILRQAVESLPERERLVVSLYYNQGRSMRSISEQLGISESRVSQVHARTLKLLRREMYRLLEIAA
ncbi:MAG: sigma-70 family RNA polymerase sigma factor [Dehalococcoidia bacterium]